MGAVYRVLAWAVVAEVLVRTAAMAWAFSGLGAWVWNGGVLDRSVRESEASAFPEDLGFVVHGLDGLVVVPVLALLLFAVALRAARLRPAAAAATVPAGRRGAVVAE